MFDSRDQDLAAQWQEDEDIFHEHYLHIARLQSIADIFVMIPK